MIPNPDEMYRGMLGNAIKECSSSIKFTVNQPKIIHQTAGGCKVSQDWSIENIIKSATEPSQVFESLRRLDLRTAWESIKKSYDHCERAGGSCQVEIRYSSDTSKTTNLKQAIDHARKIYLDTIVWHEIAYRADSRGVHNLVQNEMSSEQWLNARTMDCRVQSFVRVHLSAGAVAKWNSFVDLTASKNLFKQGQQLNWQQLNNVADDAHDSWDRFETRHTYKMSGNPDSNKGFRQSIRGWGTDTAVTIEKGLKPAFGDLGTKAIIPADDVFMFAGINTDSEGNVYAQVSYANESSS